MIIDTFTALIQQPQTCSWEYLVGTHRWGVKYEIGVSIGVPKIIWLSGPWKGAAADSTIAKQSGIYTKLPSNEAILADKSYRGDRIRFLVPLPGRRQSHSPAEKRMNYLIYSTRQTVERMIKRMRNFGFLLNRYRMINYSLHELATTVIAQLVNFCLKYNPLG
jgi:hypothetical protein